MTLLEALADRGIRVRQVGPDRLGVTGPGGGLPDDDAAFIRQHKADILRELANQPATGPTADLPVWLDARDRQAALAAGSLTWLDQVLLWPREVYEAWEERTAILQHEGRLSRGEARERAYLENRHHNVTAFPTEEPDSERGAV